MHSPNAQRQLQTSFHQVRGLAEPSLGLLGRPAILSQILKNKCSSNGMKMKIFLIDDTSLKDYIKDYI